MPLASTAQNYMLNQWGANEATRISLHTAYSSTGVNELTGAGYGRPAVTWSAAAGGTMNLASTPYNFTVPSANTVAYLGFWTAATAGTFMGMTPLGGASGYAFAVPSSTGVYLAPGSSYSSGQTVVGFTDGGSVLPSGMTAGTVYYVISPSSDTFELSATNGGTAISLASDGSGIITAITAEGFIASGTYALNSASWTIT